MRLGFAYASFDAKAAKGPLIDLLTPANRAESRLLSQLDLARLPRHIAIIMDGNGRWAGRRHLPRIAGHRAGVRAARGVIETCARLGIEALTLYAFSVENWRRPPAEVDFLMRLLREYLRKELPVIHKNNIRLRVIGRGGQLPAAVRRDLDKAMELTGTNTGMQLVVALNYGGRAELVDAFNSILEEMGRGGKAVPAATPFPPREPREPAAAGGHEAEHPAAKPGSAATLANEQTISNHLYTAGLPDPDLLIRTSGEMRVSNFLLWQIAYAEIYVTETLWPDFNRSSLLEALIEYQRRERRYGGLGPELGGADKQPAQ